MAKETFDKGVAFVFEGETEFYFYTELLEFFCSRNTGWYLSKKDDLAGGSYVIENGKRRIVICTNTVGTITQIVHSSNWFNNSCASKYSSKMPWDVFLCYDTDSHEYDISKFQENDWKTLRMSLTNRKNICVYDMAASADIEDIFLKDLASVSTFLGLKDCLTEQDIPRGRKGKSRLKALFRDHGKTYHEGIRALNLIKHLNKNTIISSNVLPLIDIEKSIFQ